MRSPSSRPAAAHATLWTSPDPTPLFPALSRSELVPVCGWCGQIRSRTGDWTVPVPGFLEAAGPALTHGVCPACAQAIMRRHPAIA